MRTKSGCFFGMLLLLPVLGGCSHAKPTFLTIQFCLGSEQDSAEFKKLIRSIAHSQHLNFIDWSVETKRNLEDIGARSPNSTDPVIHIAIEDKKDTNLMLGGNLGLGGYQVALGFGEGSNPTEGHVLADSVIKGLKARWQVLTVPAGRGAFPLKSCGSQVSRP